MTTNEDTNEKNDVNECFEDLTDTPFKKKGRISSKKSFFFAKKKSRKRSTNKPIITNILPSNHDKSDEQCKPGITDINCTDTQISLESHQNCVVQNPNNLRSPRHPKRIKRFRGFSTSISSLFLDEQVVCGAVSWFGLLASSRTEHLLNRRNASRRMTLIEGQRAPSKVLSMALVFGIILISLTYTVWGFGGVVNGTRSTDNSYRKLEQKNYYNLSPSYGLMKVRDISFIWLQLRTVVKRKLSHKERSMANDSRTLEDYYNTKIESGNGGESAQTIYWQDNQDLARNIRIFICLAFLLVLGVVGRRRRMRTRYALLKARLQDDRIYYGGSRLTPVVRSKSEDQYEGACSHTLCGCYPIDKANEWEEDAEEDIWKNADCVSTSYAALSGACCGTLCQFWVQCCSVCALAQEAREVRLLLAPKLQRLDFITHQPFVEYYDDIFFLRQSWKGMLKSKASKRVLGAHIRALSTLSRYILLLFVTVTTVIILTAILNPRAAFLWGDAFVLLMTFLQSFVVLGIVHGIFHKSDLSLDAVIKFFAAGFLIAFPMAFIFECIIINCWLVLLFSLDVFFSVIIGDNYANWIDMNYRGLLIGAEILQSFIVAAVTEEVCKYYTFRTVEHPDLIFLTGLDRYEQEEDAFNGGHEVYPFSRDNTSTINTTSYYFTSGQRQYKQHSVANPKLHEIGQLRDFPLPNEREKGTDVRTARQCAAAITIAMISGAVGLACAENFVYVFFLGGNNTKERVIILLFRSIFPVHALAAAMQSIGIIKNFLEFDGQNSIKVGVGEIVMPAIILHGTFDLVLMLLNSYVEFSMEDGGGYYNDSSNNHAIFNTVGAMCVVIVMAVGVFWYVRQNFSQKARLKLIEVSSAERVPYETHPLRYISPRPVVGVDQPVLV